MGFRFRRIIRLGKGLRLNVSKSGVSWSAGGRGATFNIGPRGAATTLGIPGTGLSYRATFAGGRARAKSGQGVATTSLSPSTTLGCLGAFVALVGMVFLLSGTSAGGLSLVGLAILLFVLQAQASKRSATSRALEEERMHQLAALLFLLQALAEAERRANLTARFGAETCFRILGRQLWIGQTQEQLREALGKPVDIDEKVLKTRRREVWKYDQTGTNRFNTRVTLDNGIVTGWDRK